MMPRFAVGSSCFARRRFSTASLPGTCGHWEMSFQSPYMPRSPSRLQNGASYTSIHIFPVTQQLGQYIRREASKVVGSHSSIPIRDASFLAAGSYSSAVAVLSSGMITRSLGAYPACFRVLYTTAAHPSPLTRFRISSVCPAGMLSRSSVTRSRPSTRPALRRSS